MLLFFVHTWKSQKIKRRTGQMNWIFAIHFLYQFKYQHIMIENGVKSRQVVPRDVFSTIHHASHKKWKKRMCIKNNDGYLQLPYFLISTVVGSSALQPTAMNCSWLFSGKKEETKKITWIYVLVLILLLRPPFFSPENTTVKPYVNIFFDFDLVI